jgi:WD40 repeat protein
LLSYATQWYDEDVSKVPTRTISVLDIETGQVIREIHIEGDFYSAEMTPTDEFILTRDSEGIRIWSVATGQLVSTLPGGMYVFDAGKDGIWLVPQLPNDQHCQRQINLYNYRTGEVVRTLGEFVGEQVVRMNLSSDGEELLLSLFMGQMIAFNIESGTRLPESMLSAQYPKAVFEDTFVTDDKRGVLYLWKKGGQEPYLTLLGERKNRKINDNYTGSWDYDNVDVEFLDSRPF